MQLVLHLGAQGTDGGQIAAWIARNRAAFEGQGTAVPAPSLFLGRLSAALGPGQAADPQARELALLRSLGALDANASPDGRAGATAGSGTKQRMLVSASGLLGSPADVLAPEGFYQRGVARRLSALNTLFGRTQVSVLLAVRRASGIIPPLWPRGSDPLQSTFSALADDTLRWARLVAMIRHHLPRARVLVWRHEDWPQVWPRIVASMVGEGQVLPPAGLFDLAASGLGAEARLRAGRYLHRHPPISAGHLRQVIDVFGRRYPGPAGHDAAVLQGLPDWLPSRLAELDAGYMTEWGDIAGLPGVQAVMPRG